MLNVATKVSEAANGLIQGDSGAGGRNGSSANARSQMVSVLGGGMTVTGDVTGGGDFRIEGIVEGSVTTDGRVVIEASGEVRGDIEAAEVIASGKVSGRINASGAVRFERGCEIEADVEAPTISLEDGGIVNGGLIMSPAGKS